MINIGGGLNSVKDIYIGNKKVTKAYTGNKLVYDKKIWIIKDGYRTNNYGYDGLYNYASVNPSTNFIDGSGLQIQSNRKDYTAGNNAGVYIEISSNKNRNWVNKIYCKFYSYTTDGNYMNGIAIGPTLVNSYYINWYMYDGKYTGLYEITYDIKAYNKPLYFFMFVSGPTNHYIQIKDICLIA